MTRTILFFLAFNIVLLFGFSIGSCQFQLEESRQFSIELHTNCSAVYIYRRVFILITEDDNAIFEQYLSDFENKTEGLLERFTNDTLYMVSRASDITNRSMTARDFNVSAFILQTVTGSSGIIEYKFTWDGFAFEDNGRIQMGDVFEVGLVLLEKDKLSVQYPKSYEVVGMEPEPDFMMEQDRRLAWLGPRLFATGTPAITIADAKGFPSNQQIFALTISSATLGISIFAFLFHRYRSIKTKTKGLTHPPLPHLGIETDEDKVVNLLRTKRGYIRQSTVAKELGFSKSKTSALLSHMEKKGSVRRYRKGREKIVALLKQQNDK